VKIDSFTVIFYTIVGIGVVISATVSTTKARLRSRGMRKLAEDFGFAYTRERLPEALNLYGTPFAHRRFTSNVLDGQCNRNRVIVFDCSVGSDTNNYSRTVIAVRTGSEVRSAADFNPAMKADSSGPWTILYFPESTKLGLSPLQELRSQLAKI